MKLNMLVCNTLHLWSHLAKTALEFSFHVVVSSQYTLVDQINVMQRINSPELVFLTDLTFEVLSSLFCQQSDVVHQSVFELIHTDDRAFFRQQLHFALNPPAAGAGGDGKNCEWKMLLFSLVSLIISVWIRSVVHCPVKWFWYEILYLYLCS